MAAKQLADSRVPYKFEAQPFECFRSVVRGYAARAAASPARFAHIDAAQTRDQVWQQVWATCVQRGLLKSPTAAERA